MELNTEINRVFGEEMAKLFAQTITDEEMLQAAKTSWNRLHSSIDSWGRENAFDRALKAEIMKRFDAKIKELLDSEPIKSDLEAQARNILDEARKKSEEKMVDEISSHIACLYTGYQGYGLRDIIASTINQMMQR